jgi:hypothetical protein
LNELHTVPQSFIDHLETVSQWMTTNSLLLNPGKTTVVVFGSNLLLPRVVFTEVSFGGTVIPISKEITCLGVTLDCGLTYASLVSSVLKSAHFHLHTIGRIRRFLTKSSAALLTQALVLSRTEYCCSLFFRIPDRLFVRLERLINRAARLVLLLRMRDSATTARATLGWMSMRERVEYRVLMLIVKILNGRGPSYLVTLLNHYVPVRDLRSADKLLLTPYTPDRRIGELSFRFAAPTVWNSLPLQRRKILWPIKL